MAPEPTLSNLYRHALSIQTTLETQDPRGSDFKSNLTEALETLQQCQTLVDRLALFSVNEDVDDIATGDLEYLAIPYHLATFTLLEPYTSPTSRRDTLRAAAQQIESYLTRLDQYKLLNSNDERLFEEYVDDRRGWRLIGEAAGWEARRNIKVTRFREEKSLQQKLEHLRQQSKSINTDDSILRSLYTSELSLFTHQSFQTLDMIAQELSILSSLPSQPTTAATSHAQHTMTSQSDSRTNNTSQAYSDRLDSPSIFSGRDGGSSGPILDARGRPLRPFTITDARSNIAKGVFKPGHNLPTMSIDEYLEEEKRRGGIIEGGAEDAPRAAERQRELDEDNMDAQDEATMKAREWDEFVEANPKGAGNTMNRG